ncbi:MAG: VOC family protein [Alphaproteobacteria bacterium]|jgi:glyoxylase I family protein|nr:VOC family protein [Alphaproteobacteria bacterium]MBT4543061.1 VOC family protein [Alphaproteobacteria bacterium]MBT7746658.1 VOC family protein [Alphaproteobacteria bacterium]
MTDANPIAYDQIDHVVLRARDIELMLAFYRDVMGCEVVRHNEPMGLYHLRAGSSMIDLVDMNGKLGPDGGAAPGLEGHNMDHFALRLKSFDAAALQAWFQQQSVDIGDEVQRFGAKGDGPSVYLSDPEGNRLELKGPSPVSS